MFCLDLSFLFLTVSVEKLYFFKTHTKIKIKIKKRNFENINKNIKKYILEKQIFFFFF
jgi:hypothetical protein